MGYKYIAHVARADEVCLVIIGQRESKLLPAYDVFMAFSYDLKSGKKTPVTERSVVGWRPWAWTSLEKGPYPDGLFKHQSCYECEAEYLHVLDHLR